MTGYDAAPWGDFAVAVAGAAAALSGLLFVAVSINIQRILSYPSLPARASQTLVMLVLPLAVSLFLLIPAQPRAVLATELFLTGLLGAAALTWLSRPATRTHPESFASWLLTRYGLSILIGLLLATAGLTLAVTSGGGLYWIPPMVVLAFVGGLANAWVLLVEILR